MAFRAPEELASARLRLRILRAEDLPDLMHLNGDDEVTRFLPYATWRSEGDAQAWFDRTTQAMAVGDTLQFVLIGKDSGLTIGTALLFRYDEGSSRAELGYVLARQQWGKGLMVEALECLLRHAFGVMGLRKIEAEVNPANRASARVLERLGFRLEGLLRQRWTGKGGSYDVSAYGLLAGEPGPVVPTIEYRMATSADTACLALLSTQVFLETYATAGIGADLAHEAIEVHSACALERVAADPRTRFLLAHAQGLLVGFVEVAQERTCPVSDGGEVEIVRLYIHPRFQRLGVGRALCARAEKLVSDPRAGSVWLTAWSGNARALAFYPAIGFEDIGRTAYVIQGQSYENRVFTRRLAR